MIENGKSVKIHYTLTVDGKIISTTRESDPLQYEQGGGQIIVGLEKVLAGLNVGDVRKVTVVSAEAYGPVNPIAVITVPKDHIEAGELREGMILSGSDSQGRTVQGIVKQVQENSVTIDFNHPLAGKDLHFDVEILEII